MLEYNGFKARYLIKNENGKKKTPQKSVIRPILYFHMK